MLSRIKSPYRRDVFSISRCAVRTFVQGIVFFGLFLDCAAAGTEKVHLQLKWFHQFQFAGYYAAQAKGFYQEEGLDVDIVEGSPDHSPDKAVREGLSEFGVHDGGDLLYQRLNGAPFVAIATVFQHSPYVIISRNFRHPAELVGLTIPITQDQGSAQILAMLRREGVKVTSVHDHTPIHFVPHSWSLAPFAEGSVRATVAYGTEIPRFRRIYGFDPAIMNPLDYGVDFYGDTLFTSDALLGARPDLVEKFRRASLRGWEYAMTHVEEMVSIIESMPTARNAKPEHQDLLDEAKALEPLVLPRLIEIGNMNLGRWRRMAQTYQELQMVASTANMDGFVYSTDQKAFYHDPKVLIAALGAFLALVALCLIWIWTLRSQVRSRTADLAADIERRKASEDRERSAKHLLDTVVENVPNMIFLKRADDLRFLLFNKAGERLLGLKSEDLLGRNDHDLFPKEQADSFEKVDRAVLRQDEIVDIPEEQISTQQGIRILHTKKVALRDLHGKPLYLLGISEDITESKHSEAALMQLNQWLEEKKDQLRELVAKNEAIRELERKHIAREIHDELGQILTALRMDASFIAMRFGSVDPALHTKVLGMRTTVDNAIQGVRNVASHLRPTALDMGLYLALDWLRQDFEDRTGVACVLAADEQNVVLDEARSTVVFRIVQESLTNISRYAEATKVFVTLGLDKDELSLEIQDNGKGFDPQAADKKKTFGLLGMKERALVLGGRLDVISAPGQGTTIGLSIPIERRTDGIA